MSKYFVSLLALVSTINAASLGDVKHVIMLMMENRSFQHVSVYLLHITTRQHFNTCSTSAPCPVFVALPTPMFRSIQTANLFGTSKCGGHISFPPAFYVPAVALNL